ncbi:hypothetical protein EDB84DRAFT_1675886 [Lactarius hengduanensis]|nr:hypothetical protein EDB84DRAFT_1675886 [Lactarius hengduanensis]
MSIKLFFLLTTAASSAQPVQLMVYVLLPPLPPGARKSDYAPATAPNNAIARGRQGDNSGSEELVHALQVAFENNWPDAGSTGPGRKKTKMAARETVGCGDDEDDEEGEKDRSNSKSKSKAPTPLDQALAAAFIHNST